MSQNAAAMSQAVERWRFSVAKLLFARHALMLLGGYCLAWGVVVLGLRVAFDMTRLPLLWGAVGLGVLLIVAWVLALRGRPAPQTVEALIDSHSQAGGLYMAQAHQAGWSLPAITLPELTWKGRRPVLIALAGGLFVIMAFAMPQWMTQVTTSRPLDVSQNVQQLQEQLQVLEKEEILTPEQAQELAQKLEQIRKEADGRDPAKTWESLDHIQSRMDDAAQQAAEQALAQTQQMTQAQMLAQAMKDHGQMFSPEQLAKAMQSLEAMTQAAAADNQTFKDMMAAQQLMAQGQQLTSEQLEKLAQAMQMSKEQLEQMLQKLNEAGMADKATLEKIQAMCQMGKGGGKEGQNAQAGQGGMDSKSVAQALAENMNGMAVEEVLLQLMQQGSGGISRGGGLSPMTWNENPSSSENTAFKDQVLPPAEMAAVRDSQRVGMSLTAPEVTTDPAASTGGVLQGQNATGSSVNQTLLPRHRAAVQKYFERNE
jgi:hypothetical protein